MHLKLNNVFLHDFHENNGAKFIPFAGYNMPINYSDGIIKEHLHVRKSVGLFDVSHMGQIIIPFENININNLQKIIPLNFNNLHLNKSYYTFILNNKGGIIDDIILSFIELKNDKYIFIVFNASRKKIDEEIFLRACSNSKLFHNHSLIALQGPLSYKIIAKFINNVSNFYFMQIQNFNFLNDNILISRSGYTGEDGFELSIPNKIVKPFIKELMKFKEIKLCGLGSRDSLRIEAGLSLYGNELSEKFSPCYSNLLWAIPKNVLNDGGFNGHKQIIDEINNGDYPKRIGIISNSKSILRSKMQLFNDKNDNIGEITSGGFSPTLKKSIAIAYINKNFNIENENILCCIRNKNEKVNFFKLPFIKHNYYRGKK